MHNIASISKANVAYNNYNAVNPFQGIDYKQYYYRDIEVCQQQINSGLSV